MDDLTGLSWNSSSGPPKPAPRYTGADLRPSPPASRGSTPFSQPSARSISPAKQATIRGGDSFANLVSFGAAPARKNLSLAERQKELAEQKARQEKEKKAQLEAQYGKGNNDEFWNHLETAGSGKSPISGHSRNVASPLQMQQPELEPIADDDDDLLAAFSSQAPVDTSTNFPIPSASSSSSRPDSLKPVLSSTIHSPNRPPPMLDDDDDPFGLSQLKQKPIQRETAAPRGVAVDDDDDILGPLAKPVSEFAQQQQERQQEQQREQRERRHRERSPSTPRDAGSSGGAADGHLDRPLAELVDMGFPVEDAREALAVTESGSDVQAAVGWLLNRAHAESQRKAQAKRGQGNHQENEIAASREQSSDRGSRRSREANAPAWMRGSDQIGASRSRSETPDRERDPAQVAAEFGNNLFKSANSLWKTSTRRVQKAVQDFNSPSDPSQPRWMRSEPVSYEETRVHVPEKEKQPSKPAAHSGNLLTDEAMMLESRPPPSIKSNRSSPGPQPSSRTVVDRSRSPALLPRHTTSSLQGSHLNGAHNNSMGVPVSRLNRLVADEEAGQAYISPARRRKAATPIPKPQPESPDLLEQSSATIPRRQQEQTASPAPSRPSPARQSTPIQQRPKAPPRSIPPIQPSSLQTSIQHRQKGSEAFKRGDYSAAHIFYSEALSMIPDAHPIAIVILTNRALTSLKIGEPKSAISDADRAISIIGPSKGESEKLNLGNGGEASKDMKDFFGKALMRKAEALEQLERWVEAAKIWQEAVESGHGGSTSIQGRNRCERAAGVRQLSASAPAAPKPTAGRQAPARRPPPRAAAATLVSTKPAEAVSRLRAANEAADRVDNEKFALTDAVEARITAWKGGKQDNLRALLASLENVLWPEAQWKKINMSELLLPNKVKVQYMKGIAKVHPDKIPVNATTEQRMIAGAVFSTLNEAWDKFKQENGL